MITTVDLSLNPSDNASRLIIDWVTDTSECQGFVRHRWHPHQRQVHYRVRVYEHFTPRPPQKKKIALFVAVRKSKKISNYLLSFELRDVRGEFFFGCLPLSSYVWRRNAIRSISDGNDYHLTFVSYYWEHFNCVNLYYCLFNGCPHNPHSMKNSLPSV